MSETLNSTVWLTQEAYDKLVAELDHLKGEGREEVSRKIAQARSEGDLSENGGYHAAREEQGKNEGRIVQLTQLLENAQVGEAPADDGIIEAGMVVTAEIAGDEMTFLMGSREVAEDLTGGEDLEVFSERSPMGAAINGHKVGETVSYQAPNGKDITVKILKAKPFSR